MTGHDHLPPIRLIDVVMAEMSKIVTMPIAIVSSAVVVATNLIFAMIDVSGLSFYVRGVEAPLSLGSFSVVMFAPVYVFMLLPVAASASEHRHGQLRLSLAATPRRSRLAASKILAMLAVTSIAAVLAVSPARVVIGIHEGHDVAAIMFDALGWTSAYMGMSVVAFSLAGVLKSAAAALGTLISLPLFLSTGILQWPEGIRFLPDQASLSLIGTPAYDVTALEPDAAAAVLAAWVGLSLALYISSIRRRDA